MPPEYYDVIIIGGGPAGCATALSISQIDSSKLLRILVIDDTECIAHKIGESLPAAARLALVTLHPDLLRRLTQDTTDGRHEVCTGTASSWSSPKLHETFALMSPYGSGWHLDRVHFDDTLRETCGPIVRKGKFIALRRMCAGTGDASPFVGWEIDVHFAGNSGIEMCRTRWLVDATGRKASAAHEIGAKMQKHCDLLAFYLVLNRIDYADRIEAASGTARGQEIHDTDPRTLIEASSSGWWYSVRLPHGRRLFMYTTSPYDPTARIARRTDGFLDMIRSQTTHISQALGDETLPLYECAATTGEFTHHTAAGSSALCPPGSWEPVAGTEADEQGRGWCSVGDAALAFDPLSSQGIITALQSGALLGSVLARHLIARDNSSPNPHPAVSGAQVVQTVLDSYRRVQMKYEDERAYYYATVKRFDAAPGGDGEKYSSFWKQQATRRT
ncbi:hypothetical protein K488DRAFT_91373 [Vararia minispora EC-137]|uniref:Uncharacterized protein n=1 Tax=Vararia minispora EC-137 TaxID=1314806 RepID=A0ACB8Q613_9AGAM|nr:hypothetical protein K488DRAFT_91373 [Vararia minispora EC-137]